MKKNNFYKSITTSFKQTEMKILILLFFIGFILRIWHVGSLPSILNRDEAALAYNAYLLKDTGQDEWGRSWPLYLESFGDFKLPGYPWLIIPSFFVFGFNDFAVRFPSVLAGSILIILSYFFTKRLGFSKTASLITAGLITFSPVLFFYSRMAYEANVGLAYLVAILLIIIKKNTTKKQKIINIEDILAILISLLAVFTYNTPFLLLPFIIISIPVLRGFKHWRKWLFLVFGFTIVFIISAKILIPLSSQKSGITIFSDETTWMHWINYREKFSGLSQKILGHKMFYLSIVAITNFIKSFSPNFLITNGGTHPWHSLPGFAHFYSITYILSFIGLAKTFYEFIKNKLNFSKNKYNFWLIYLLFIGLLPSIVTTDSPHTTRSLLFFFILTIFSAKGFESILKIVKSKKHKIYYTIILAIIFSVQATTYFYSYFIKYSSNQSMYKPGFSEIIQKSDELYSHNNVAIVDPDGYQYIVASWYLKLDSNTYFSTIIRQDPDKIGFRYGQQLKNYHFIANENDRSASEKILIKWKNNMWNIEKF